jgi:hypothetical protein
MMDDVVSKSGETDECFATGWIEKRVRGREYACEVDTDCRTMRRSYSDSLLDVVKWRGALKVERPCDGVEVESAL